MKAKVYPENVEAKLGFDHVRNYIKQLCQSRMGREEAENMSVSDNWREVKRLLVETSEMKGLFESSADLPDVCFNDLGAWLAEIRVPGSYAPAEKLLQLDKSLVSYTKVREFYLKKASGDSGAYALPALAEIFSAVSEFPEIAREIERCIDKSGYVKDSASPELAEVRSSLLSLNGSMSRAVQKIYAQAVNSGVADKENGPTMRDGRMVIPVPSANKRNLNGIVHDESASGKTVFIEPAEVVALGNRMRELQMAEQREIVKILVNLASLVRPEIDHILASNAIMGKLDFIMAKAKYAMEVGGSMPVLENRTEIDWYGAVHPVLLLNLRRQGKTTVPLNLRLDSKHRFLVISGPNAGGKSVALKTVGIVQYMCQCGMLPTLYSNSHMGIFEKIFIDIGDEQSIENDLSTYSSHLRNMKFFITNANKRTLILADEIGSGTEPAIGGALAQAILAELAAKGSYGVITTHYYNLKQFAEETEGFVNGAMLYDRQHLQPTFQLSVGTAGSSFALEIAGKIGLPKEVLEMAKDLVGKEYVESDRYLMDIARDRRYWQNKRQNIREKEAKLESMLEKYENMAEELRQKRSEILREAKNEAREILATTNAKIENTITQIREAQAEKEKTKKLRGELDGFKKEINDESGSDRKLESLIKPLPKKPRQRNNDKEAKKEAPAVAKKTLEVGDYVKMPGSSTPGKIILISGKKAEVAFGNLRTTVKLDALSPASKPVSKITSGVNLINATVSEASRERQLNFKNELDVRGNRADEALDKVIRFIDDAIQFGIPRVRILHGTGHGILRAIIRQQLDATPGVLRYEDEDVRFGGAGITVVNLN